MGGSSSSKKVTETITNTETNVTTNTSTNIGEIGLTGNDAVAMADIINTGGVAQAEINAGLLKTIVQESGKGFQQLVGGANALVASSEGMNKSLLDTTERVSGGAFDLSGQGLDLSYDLSREAFGFGESAIGTGESLTESFVKAGKSFGENLVYSGQDILQGGTDLISDLFGKAQDITQSMIGSAQTYGQSLVKAGEGVVNPAGQALESANAQTSAIKTVAIAAIAVFGIYMLMKRGKHA